MPSNSEKERKKRAARQSERGIYISAILAGAVLLGSLLWASGVLTQVPRIGRYIAFGALTLLCLILLLPGVQTWLARRDERDEMERWRK